MKINLLNYFYSNKPLTLQKTDGKSENNFKYNAKYFSIQSDTVSFGNKSKIPAKALKSLQEQKERLLQKYKPEFLSLLEFDLKELEGLQNGIEIFEGLNFRQIAYLIRNLNEVVVQRGCSNGCIHCYAEAQTPHYMKTHKFLNEIDFEDYQNLINGFGELNNRLGFNAFQHYNHSPLVLFHDTDCSTIFLKDKNGKVYDYADLAKMLHDVTGKQIVFDTTGWTIKDTKTQKRMEDLVQKVVNSDEYNFMEFYVSINPFHSLYNKSIELTQEGKFEKAKKLKEIYNNRIANAIFTFSPLLEKRNTAYNLPMLSGIVRSLNVYSEPIAYSGSALRENNYSIFKKICDLYDQDLDSGCKKVITDKRQLIRYIDAVYSFLRDRDYRTFITNKKLLSKINDQNSLELQVTQSSLHNSAKIGKSFHSGITDLNGKFYMFNFAETYPTDIALKYKNAGKTTAPIAPNLRDEVITNRLIASLYPA